ncbi:MAG: insulinase family protein [Mailhella sp.]|nr:insulinase family protein [Mailhella sp.]
MREVFSAGADGKRSRRPVLEREAGGELVLRGVEVARLRNGLTLSSRKDDRFSQILFRLEVKAGTAWEKPEEAGLSHLVEHMAFAAGEGGMDMYARAELCGGSVSATTGLDLTTFFVEVPAERWQEGLALLHRLVFEMPLAQSVLDAEREVVIAELKENAGNEGKVRFDSTVERMFAGTPYGKSLVGTEATLHSITLDAVRDYVCRRYVPRDMVLCVVGDVEASALLEAADALFGGEVNAGPSASCPAIPVESFPKGVSVEVKEMGKYTSLCMGFPVSFVRPRLAASIAVLVELLEGSDAAFLKRRLCFETSVARHIQVTYEAFERAGSFLIEAVTEQDGIEDCLRELAAALSSLSADDFTEEQIAQACSRLADGNMKALERAEFVADVIGDENLHAAASMSGWMPVARFQDIGREQIRQALDLCLNPEAVTVTVLTGDAEEGPAADEDSVKAAVQEGWPELGKILPGEEGDGERPAEPELMELGEGRSLVLLPDASLPFVAATLCFSGGEVLADEEGGRGLDILARLLPFSPGGRTRLETAEWLYAHSASFHACRSVDDVCLNIAAPRRFSSELFAFLKEAVERPVFREEDVEREQSLAAFEDDRLLQSFQLFRYILLKDGPYRSSGWISGPEPLSAAELEELWAAQASRPWTLCVSGDFDREEAEAFARSLPVPSAPKVEAAVPGWEEFGPFAVGCDPSEQSVYALGFHAPGQDSPDRPAMEMLLRCLNGGGGLLYRALRHERQLCYSAEALDWCEGKAGFVGICVQTAPEHMEEAADALEAVIDRLCEEGPDAEELERGRAEAASFIRRRMQDIGGRAFEAARQVLRGRGLDFERRWAEGLRAVTAEDVRDVARRHLVLEEAAELCIMPEDAMEG